MSEENVEIVREAFARWNRRDIDYWVRHSHAKVEIWSKYAALEQRGEPYRGARGVREWRAEIDRNFELHEVFAEDLRESGENVIVLGGVHFRGKTSGDEMRHPFAWICEMEDRAIRRMYFYSSHAEALEAAGLSE